LTFADAERRLVSIAAGLVVVHALPIQPDFNA